jgi:hypothetical protein
MSWYLVFSGIYLGLMGVALLVTAIWSRRQGSASKPVAFRDATESRDRYRDAA